MVSCCWLARAQYDKSLGRIEKWVMRKAFDDEEHPYLPKVKQEPPVSEGFQITLGLLCAVKSELTLVQFLHPQHILYRQKEQFSDGVGYSWIDGLKAFTEQQVIFL